MAEILVVLPDTMTDADKGLLRKAGIVVVESSDPASVRFLRPGADLDGGDLALAAMQALNKAGGWNQSSELFVKLIDQALQRKAAREAGNAT